jgi:transaldolase
MKFFVDTADVAAIKELNDLGMVDGVTTNRKSSPNRG